MSQTALSHAAAEPTSIEESGLPETMFEHLILKFLYFRGEMYGKDLSDELGVRFSVIEQLVESLKLRHTIQVKRALSVGNIGAVLALTEAGRARTHEILEDNQYYGPAPVPMEQYAAMVRRQRPQDGWLTREILANAYRGMVLTPNILSQIGPAVSSLNSLLIYGKPGNGKTYLIEALANLHIEPIYLPYALECQGNIVQVFDPIYHTRVEDEQSTELTSFEPTWDRRWCKIKRPFIVSGGELTLDMLDLHFNTTSRIYEAPFQLKANNGVYLVDDFGRQKASPAEVLNRWIVPMERRVDYLSFLTGGKMTVPFETFLVFSTNLNPTDLGDEAFLRRIQYKLLLRGPSEPEFCEIFARFCDGKKLPYTTEMIDRFVNRYYRPTGKEFRRCHPRDLLTHALNLIHFEKLPYELTDELLDRAYESCFVQDVEEARPVTQARKAATAIV
jgi:SpoVK/Ycf46/Vps4 family AAA+-type ATPase